MNRNLAYAIALLVLGNVWTTQAAAHSLTPKECSEGGDFIRNAALARDNGISREFFVGKLTEDLAMIQSFPPHLRWFVQDASDEQLLSDAVFKVFDEPTEADQHQAAFVSSCMQAAGSINRAKI